MNTITATKAAYRLRATLLQVLALDAVHRAACAEATVDGFPAWYDEETTLPHDQYQAALEAAGEHFNEDEIKAIEAEVEAGYHRAMLGAKAS